MIHFFLRLSLKGISKRRQWLLMAFIPVIIYWVVSAAIPDRFIIRQEISITSDALFSLSPRPSDLRALQELISTPDLFFLDRFALSLLAKRLDIQVPSIENQSPKSLLISKIKQCLTLQMIGKDTVKIVYQGNDRKQGEIMVIFYSERFIKQAKDYLTMNPSVVEKGAIAPRLIGRIDVEEKRSFWRYDRLVPALILFFVSLIGLSVLIALLEWFKSSFRSERHIARYLGVPILGALPDLNDIVDNGRRKT